MLVRWPPSLESQHSAPLSALSDLTANAREAREHRGRRVGPLKVLLARAKQRAKHPNGAGAPAVINPNGWTDDYAYDICLKLSLVRRPVEGERICRTVVSMLAPVSEERGNRTAIPTPASD